MTEAREITENVVEDLTPSDDERRNLEQAFENVRERAQDALDDYRFTADVELVGSTARDSWLAGDRDIDVFLLLPEDLPREKFEEVGLDVGRQVFPDGTVEYAEHPYVKGVEDGYDVDIVPCYSLDDPSEVRSAVDRTPFHQRYVEDEMFEGFGDQARLTKAFARGAGVYGSDLRTRGFGGYLCELLVLHYGGFHDVVEAAADWTPPVEIEFQTPTREHDDPLVVVDPVDPARNVATVVSKESFARFVQASRDFLRQPSESQFYPDPPEPTSEAELQRYLDERDTSLSALAFTAPDVVEDQLYPQLRKTRRGLVEEIERQGFDVIRSTAFADEDAVVLIEANVARQSKVEKHQGPPVHVREHAEAFRDEYSDADVTGPYVEDGRYVVERPRRHSTIPEFLRSDDVLDVGLGRQIEDEIEDGYRVLVDDGCLSLLDDFAEEIGEHLHPR